MGDFRITLWKVWNYQSCRNVWMAKIGETFIVKSQESAAIDGQK